MTINLPESAYRHLSCAELAARWSCSRPTVWRKVREEKVPAPRETPLGTRWWLPEIIEWEISQGMTPAEIQP